MSESSARARPFTPAQERIGRLLMRAFSPLNVWVYQRSGGRLGSRFPGGAPVCLLVTTGRRSGQRRTTPLLYLEDQGRVVVVASQGGMSTHPLWYLNLCDDPDVEVEIGRQRRRMRARTASDEEKQTLWPKLVALYASFDAYQARTERDIPVVILEPR
jgi:F420H(2)-dependent quinone reductase